MRRTKPKVAQKIERDAFQTRGASWGRDQAGGQARRNRQPRWTLKAGDAFFPAHYQTYEVCLRVAAELTCQAYAMYGAPPCPDEDAQFLPRLLAERQWLCPICRLPIDFSEFDLAQQSKAAIDTDHLDPSRPQRHLPQNVAFVHHICNTTKGDRSIEEFLEWSRALIERH